MKTTANVRALLRHCASFEAPWIQIQVPVKALTDDIAYLQSLLARVLEWDVTTDEAMDDQFVAEIRAAIDG